MDANLAASPFDEVPLLYVRAQASSAIARAPTCRLHDNSVDLKRRPPKSLPGRTLAEKPKLSRFEDCGPQGLRRPRFSFFRFTCQTARNRAVPPTSKPEGRRSLTLPIGNRKLGHRISVRCFAGASSRPKGGRRAERVYIGLRRALCQQIHARKIAGFGSAQCKARGGRGPAASQGARGPGNCAAGGATPYCGHIPPPFFALGGRCQFGGLSAPGSHESWPVRRTRNRLKRLA